MLVGPFYVCWLYTDDSEILDHYKKYGTEFFSDSDWSKECDKCATKSCQINTGFAEGMKKIYIDVEEWKVIHA